MKEKKLRRFQKGEKKCTYTALVVLLGKKNTVERQENKETQERKTVSIHGDRRSFVFD